MKGKIEFSCARDLLYYVKFMLAISRFSTIMKILNTENIRGYSDLIVLCNLET